MSAKSDAIYEIIDKYINAMELNGRACKTVHITKAQHDELLKAHRKDWPDREFSGVYRGAKIEVVEL